MAATTTSQGWAIRRFDVGQTVRIGRVRTPLADYTGQVGRVVAAHKMLKASLEECDGQTRRRNGPRMTVDDIRMVKCPTEWDGTRLVVTMPGGTRVTYTPDGWDYTVEIPGIWWRVGVREKDLRPL